jgi:hypothetical protein
VVRVLVAFQPHPASDQVRASGGTQQHVGDRVERGSTDALADKQERLRTVLRENRIEKPPLLAETSVWAPLRVAGGPRSPISGTPSPCWCSARRIRATSAAEL